MIQTFYFKVFQYSHDSLYNTTDKLNFHICHKITNFLLYFPIFFSISKMFAEFKNFK